MKTSCLQQPSKCFATSRARGDIHYKEIDRATKTIKQARALIDIIKEARPITRVKDRIWVAEKHLSYEDTEEVMPDLIPIYSSLDEIEDIVPVDKARKHIDMAKEELKLARKSADKKIRTEAEKMGKDIDALKEKINRGDEETMAALRGLLFRNRAMAEREAERVSVSLQNLSAGSKAKVHLIDAKLHLAYAESEQFIHGKSADVENNLDTAEKELHSALEFADESVMNKIAAIEKETDTLKTKIHSKEAVARMHYKKLKADLRQLIKALPLCIMRRGDFPTQPTQELFITWRGEGK